MSSTEDISAAYISPGSITSDPGFGDRAMRVMAETGCTPEEAVQTLMGEDEPRT